MGRSGPRSCSSPTACRKRALVSEGGEVARRTSPFSSLNARSAHLSPGVYGIIDTHVTPDPLALLAALLRAEIRTVQLRAKAGVDRDLVRAMLLRTRAANAVLVINDDLDAALQADGWHAGQEDLIGRDLAAIRLRLGTRLLGISCGTPGEALQAQAAGADYVGTGPFAATGTKADAGPAIGRAGIAAVVRAVAIPVVAIGGIELGNIAEVAASGARMAAVVSAIARAPDPELAARALQSAWSASG